MAAILAQICSLHTADLARDGGTSCNCVSQTVSHLSVWSVLLSFTNSNSFTSLHVFVGNQGAVNWSTYITIIAGWIPLISHNLVHQRAKEGQQDTTAMANSVCNSDPSVPAASQSNSHSSGAPLAADMEHTDAGDPANEDETGAPTCHRMYRRIQ